MLRRLIAWTSGQAPSVGSAATEAEGGCIVDKALTLRSATLIGLAIGLLLTTFAIHLKQLVTVPPEVGIEQADVTNYISNADIMAGVCAGFSAGLVFSGCAGALPADENNNADSPWARLTLFRAQLFADVVAYESDVFVTTVTAVLTLALYAVLRPIAAACVLLSAVPGLAFSIAVGEKGIVLGLCLIFPVAVNSGMVRQSLAGILCGGLLVARFWIRFLQDKLLYHSRRYDPGATVQWGEVFDFGGQTSSFHKVSYSFAGRFTGDLEQTALLIRPESREASCLWVLHGGNAMLATDWIVHLDRMLRTQRPIDAAFLLVDYPGYGWNSGRPTPLAVVTASKAAVNAAFTLLGSTPQVNCLGHSLGCAAVSQLATELSICGLPPGRMILSAPFLDIPCMAMRVLGGLLPASIRSIFPPLLRALVPHQWKNTEHVPAAAKAGWRVSIVHGSLDELVPCTMGKELQTLALEAIYSGKSVEACGLNTSALNGARGRVTGVQEDRIQVLFEQQDEPKAVKQHNLRILDPASSTTSERAPVVSFNLISKAGHNDVLVQAERMYAELICDLDDNAISV